jgi:hypothetical protein
VPPEPVFDRGLSDLFVIRTGAQTLSDGLKIVGGRYDLDTSRVQIIA